MENLGHLRDNNLQSYAWPGVGAGKDLGLVDYKRVSDKRGRFLLRPLFRQGERWQLDPLGPESAPIPLNPEALEDSGVFGVRVVHQLLRSKTLTPPQTPQRSPHPADAPGRSSGRRPLRQRRSSGG